MQSACLLSDMESFKVYHCDNAPMPYAAIFNGCKIDNFQMKKCDIFGMFAQNIDCGYTLELPL